MKFFYIILAIVVITFLLLNLKSFKFKQENNQKKSVSGGVYRIDDKEVSESEFLKFKSNLNISEELAYHAEIAKNPMQPESYPAGVEMGYEAIDKTNSEKYVYITIEYPEMKFFELRKVNDEVSLNKKIMELKDKESKTFFDLTITNLGGGHKILPDENGLRSGDLSFAELKLQTPRLLEEKHRIILDTEGAQSFDFDNYKITVNRIDWDGELVILEVERVK